MTPAAWVALHARRYMETLRRHQRGLRRDRGRRPRATPRPIPDAWFYERPITLDDHQASRWIVEPVLRLLDCCQESDGGVALVVTSAERARDLRQPPAVIAARRAGRDVRRRDDDELLPRRPHRAARDGRGRPSGCGRCPASTPADISTAFLYDHFTPFVLMQLEELGFCGRGEAKDFATVERLSLGGELPDQHERRAARRGVHPRHERHHRSRCARSAARRATRSPTSSTCSSPRAPAYRRAA